MALRMISSRMSLIGVLLSIAVHAQGVTVSYSANLSTSKGNPVTDILILEGDGSGPAQATVFPGELPGLGTVVINHEAARAPVRSLIIGLTEGMENGVDKTQIIMFLDSAFAAAHVGIAYSQVFVGARHNDTVARLEAAAAGDADQLAWFAGPFFTDFAADATFASAGPFAVAEFTVLNTIGNSATAGNWMITSFQSLPIGHANAQSNRTTALFNETAKVDNGPFDIELLVLFSGEFAIDKTVLNNTGTDWRAFRLELGTGVGPNFVPSTTGDSLSFISALNNREDTGSFPDVEVDEDRILFTGSAAPGDSPRFIAFVRSNTGSQHTFTIRQVAIGAAAPAPVLNAWALAALVAVLVTLASLRIRRLPRPR